MAIPYKTWMRLTDALTEYRVNPTDARNDELLKLESVANWPYSASQEQMQEWDGICDRTRSEFESRMAEKDVIHCPKRTM